MAFEIFKIYLSAENEVVALRQYSRHIAEAAGLGSNDQVRIATAVSEISRQAYAHYEKSEIIFSCDIDSNPGRLTIELSSRLSRPIILTLSGDAKMPRVAFAADAAMTALRLVDDYSIETDDGKRVISLIKYLPRSSPMYVQDEVRQLQLFCRSLKANPFQELTRQNNELVFALSELTASKHELELLTQELSDTNRGVVALYGELEERAAQLKYAYEAKSRFLSNTSHELRTPLGAILSITQLLADKTDGDLTAEQDKQVGFVARAASDLLGLVNDLLDIAKIESGKISLECRLFSVQELFSMLKGIFRPMQGNFEVALIFEDVPEYLLINSDEKKISQILKNLISNALKFTPAGSVVVGVREHQPCDICFLVKDTGIGIDSKNSSYIFEEFAQIENPLQKNFKGTGLGLSLSKALANALGGELRVESTPGLGSLFTLAIPNVISATTNSSKVNAI